MRWHHHTCTILLYYYYCTHPVSTNHIHRHLTTCPAHWLFPAAAENTVSTLPTHAETSHGFYGPVHSAASYLLMQTEPMQLCNCAATY